MPTIEEILRAAKEAMKGDRRRAATAISASTRRSSTTV